MLFLFFPSANEQIVEIPTHQILPLMKWLGFQLDRTFEAQPPATI